MRKSTLGRRSSMAVAISASFSILHLAMAATPGPLITVTALGDAPTVAIGSQGNFVVGWLAPNASNYGGHGPAMVSPYAANGSAIGSAPIALGSESSLAPAVAMDADSDFVATWVEATETKTTIGFKNKGNLYAQRYSADASANGPRIHVTNTSDYFSHFALAEWGSGTSAPQVVMDDGGDFDLAWGTFNYIGSCNLYGACESDSGTSKIYVASYRADGTVARLKTVVDKTSLTANKNAEGLMGLSRLGNGDVSFTAYSYTGYPLSSQLLSPSLVKVGAKLTLGNFTDGIVVATAADGNGNTAVLFTNFSDKNCTVSRFDTTGAAIGTPTVVPLGAVNFCGLASLAENASGAFAVVWAGGANSSQGVFSDVYGQYFNADGSANGESFAIRQGGSQILNVTAALNASGGLAVAWTEAPVQGHAIYARSISQQ